MEEPLRLKLVSLGRCDVRRCKEPALVNNSFCRVINGEEVWAGGSFCRKHSEEFTREMLSLQAEGGPP